MNPCASEKRQCELIDGGLARPAFLHGFQTSLKQLEVIFPSCLRPPFRRYAWSATEIRFGHQNWLLLIAQGRLCTLLVQRLLHVQGRPAVRHPLAIATAILSRRHIFRNPSATCVADRSGRFNGVLSVCDKPQSTALPSPLNLAPNTQRFTKRFTQCRLSDMMHEIVLASRASSCSALNAAAVTRISPFFADVERAEAVLQRHPLVRGSRGLVCTGTADSKRAWCSMLSEFLDVPGMNISDAVLLRIYLVCKQCANRRRVRLCDQETVARARPAAIATAMMRRPCPRHPFTADLAAHPAASLAGRDFLDDLSVHFVCCLASRISVQRWELMFRCRSPSQRHAQQWNVIGIDIGMQRRRVLSGRGGLYEALVLRLLCFQGKCGVRFPLNLARCILSRRHFLWSKKKQLEHLFEEGRQLHKSMRFSEAAKIWGQAAMLKHGPSHAFLSDMLCFGRGDVRGDGWRMIQFATAGAALGCGHSKGALGRCYLLGIGVSKDAAKALALGRESAAGGSCFGQLVVAMCHEQGLSVAQDYAEAARLYELAAEQGHALAQYNLAVLFCHGRGVAKDDAEGVRLYGLAAAQGDALAQSCLGFMFEFGRGVAQDYEEAARLYRLAAAQGLALAIYNLGVLYENGRGVEQDDAEAVRLFKLAAAKGNAAALNNLGLLFENGRGVPLDRAEAIRLYRSAAAMTAFPSAVAHATAALQRLGAC